MGFCRRALGLNPGANEGTICSAPIALSAEDEVRINADGASGLSVDLLDERFQPISGFTGGQVVDGTGNGLDCSVRWAGHTLEELGGRSVLVQAKMQRMGNVVPRVYALYRG